MGEQNIFNLRTLLPLNIQYFADDFEITDEQRNQLFSLHEQEQGGSGEEIIDDEEIIDNEEVIDDENGGQDELESDEGNQDQNHLSEDQQVRDAAFADMRRQMQEAQAQAAFVQRMADHYGMTPEELQQQWLDDQLERQAQDQNVPVEVLRKQNQLESEVAELRHQTESQRVQAQISEVMAKHGADEASIQSAVDYIQQNNLSNLVFSGALPFEQAYKLAHMESMIDTAKKDAVQKSLSDKKKRQQAAQPKPNGGSNASVDEDDLDAKAAAAAASIIKDGYF